MRQSWKLFSRTGGAEWDGKKSGERRLRFRLLESNPRDEGRPLRAVQLVHRLAPGQLLLPLA